MAAQGACPSTRARTVPFISAVPRASDKGAAAPGRAGFGHSKTVRGWKRLRAATDNVVAKRLRGKRRRRMGTVCARRSQQDETEFELVDSDTDVDTDVQENWQRVVRRARRLGVIRRRWAITGHWLREVKARGRR